MNRNPIELKHEEMRAKYMAEEITHDEFYLWLGQAIGATEACHLPCSIEEIKRSTDPYLNDIRLSRWDMQNVFIQPMARRAGIRYWSLSNTVCVLKALAKKLAKEAAANEAQN